MRLDDGSHLTKPCNSRLGPSLIMRDALNRGIAHADAFAAPPVPLSHQTCVCMRRPRVRPFRRYRVVVRGAASLYDIALAEMGAQPADEITIFASCT